MDINSVKPEPILINHAINAAIAAFAEAEGRLIVTAAVTHADQQIDNHLLEKDGL